MDSEIIYSLIGIAIFILVIVLTLRSSSASEIQTKVQKKEQIIGDYKKELKSALEPLKDNKKAYIAKKSELLKRFSNEISMNIFFDKDEIRSIIQDLSKE